MCWLLSGIVLVIGDTDFGHCSEFRGFKGWSLLGGYNYLVLCGVIESLGHYSEVGCFSEEFYCIYYVATVA